MLRSLLHRLVFLPGPHLRPVLLGNVVPWLILAGYRVVVALQEVPESTLRDLWRTSYGDTEWWWGWAFGWALALSFLDPGGVGPWRQRLAWASRVGMHILTTFVFVISLLDLQFYAVTGSRGDWDAIGVLLSDLPQFWPVVTSEFKLWHGILLSIAGVFAVLPALWRARSEGSWWRVGVWLLILPIAYLETEGRPKPRRELKTLQASAPEHLYWDGIERLGEVLIPPDPADLAPRVVRPGPDFRPYNVVVVFLESVGAARTSLHNPTLTNTPQLQELAKDALVFDQLYSVVPHTSKALVSSLCGHWPHLVTDVHEARPGGLPGACLPELLGSLGYKTSFYQPAREEFEDRFRLLHQLGFDQYWAVDALPPGFEEVNYFGIEDRAMLAPGLNWSAQQKDPFLAVYLTLTSHHDYKVPEIWPVVDYPDVSGKLEEQLNSIAYVDDFVGKLVQGYKDRGLYENTVFLVLGDHGEAFGEHRRHQHDLVIWEEGMHVPGMLFGGPLRGRAERVPGAWSQVDLLPTLLTLVGAEVQSGSFPGADMLAPPPNRVLMHSCWRSHRCLARREGEKKFIDHYRERNAQYFDIADDPLERRDRIEELSVEERERLRSEAREWRSRVNGRYEAIRADYLQKLPRLDSRPAAATWGGRISALGCSVQTPVVPSGASAWASCTWRSSEQLREGWQVRTRVRSGDQVAEDRWFPVDGLLPTWSWEPGMAIDDSIRFKLPADFPAGEAVLEVGWARFGGRVSSRDDGGDWWTVGTIQVLPR